MFKKRWIWVYLYTCLCDGGERERERERERVRERWGKESSSSFIAPGEPFQSSLIKNSSLSDSLLIPPPPEQSICIPDPSNTFQTEKPQSLMVGES